MDRAETVCALVEMRPGRVAHVKDDGVLQGEVWVSVKEKLGLE